VRAFIADLRTQQRLQQPSHPAAAAAAPPLLSPKSHLADGGDPTHAAKQFSLETDSLYLHIQRALDGLDKAAATNPTVAAAAPPAVPAPALSVVASVQGAMPSATPAVAPIAVSSATKPGDAAALAMQSSEKDAAAGLAALAASLFAGAHHSERRQEPPR
jgi:hypothetical protein